MAITKFDRATVRAFIDEMEQALQAVADKHGLRLKQKTCRFGTGSCSVPFEFEIDKVDEEGNHVTPEWETYQRMCALYNLRAEWLGQWLQDGSRKIQIVGLNPRRKKYPVMGVTKHGGLIKMNPTFVITRMTGGKAKEA